MRNFDHKENISMQNDEELVIKKVGEEGGREMQGLRHNYVTFKDENKNKKDGGVKGTRGG